MMINFGPKDLVILGNLIMKIYKTRPKVHKVRVQRMKSRISVLEEQLQMAKDVVSDSVHVQQTVCRLEQVLEDALNLMMKMEDLSWIERFIKNSSVDGNFADLNQRLSQESLSLVLSLNINTQVVQQTFSEDRRKAEDEKDRAADMKFLEEMKETLLLVKDNVEEIKCIVKNTNDMMKDLKAEQDNPPVSSEEDAPPAPFKAQAPAPIQQAPPYIPAPPQVYQQAPALIVQTVQMAQPGYVTLVPQPVQMVQQQQTPGMICSGNLGGVPTMTMCQHCREPVQTRVVYHSGVYAWLICILCIVFGAVCGCCLIPFFMESCKDAHHFCTKCNVKLGVRRRM
ncbi:uncharacterized protein LOC119908454 [Micropterus salmoides]|uniref:uncharacterized protein LOC119908454 n=1 Tax=Micropterus salmoides TaxID=27706 RepID=UPI0018ECB977|nr:uncharacterized protein LOC119908454 [Micropterus salmoides]